ncbi:MAG: hypothetical protein MUC69_09720 [Gemmatimonadales bacterium]|jgi:anti-sigma factor RsiW|nr:hypothetical protein [Gemmatimonadales bacterium]
MTRSFEQHLTPDELDHLLELPPTAALRVHLASCPACTGLVAADKALVQELSRLALHVPRAGFEERVMARVQVPAPASATAAFRRRHLSTRRSLLTAAALVLGLVGSMAASVAWSLAHQDALLAFGSTLRDGAVQVLWTSVQGLAAILVEQPWYAGARTLLDSPTRLAFALGAAITGWLGGVLLLRRLIALPDRRVAHGPF